LKIYGQKIIALVGIVTVIVLASIICFSNEGLLVQLEIIDPPCKDPKVGPDFEIAISRCEDALIHDFSPDGKSMVVSTNAPGFFLIDLSTLESVPLPISQGTPQYLNGDIILYQFGAFLVPENEAVELEILDISESDKWQETLSKAIEIYALEFIVVAQTGNTPSGNFEGYVIKYGNRNVDSIVSQLIKNGFELIFLKPFWRNCPAYNNPCASHNGIMELHGDYVIVAGEDILIDLHDFPEEVIQPKGWSWDNHYYYFNFMHNQKIGYIFSGPNYPSGIARFVIPDEYWKVESP
jgi:hypothetical protein